MPHEFEEHLLSAYLDNELSADERALVEERLKTDPGAQQLLDDLKRVRSLVSTLPRWQGDARPMISGGQSAAMASADEAAHENPATESPAVAKPSESDGSTTSSRVDFSATSLAESRLRQHDHVAEVRTRRSMRWTTIVAVAATLATLMLGAPYLLRDWGPKTELAQHSDFSSRQAAPESASEPAPGAAPVESKSMAARRSAGEKSSLATGEASEQTSEKSGVSADHDAYSLRQSDAETTGNAYFAEGSQAPSRGEPTQQLARGMQTPALESRAKTLGDNAPKRDRANASGGVALSERSEPSLSVVPSAPANEPQSAVASAVPEAAAPPAAQQPSQRQFWQDIPNYGAVAGGGAAPAAQGPAAVAPLSQSFDAGKRIAADQPHGGPATPSPAASAAAPQIMTARSDAWNEAEVEAAMTRVWFFVSPGATADAAVALQAVPQQPASGMGIDSFGARADQPASQASANYAYGAQPADEMNSAAGAAADRKLAEKPGENSAALSKARSADIGGIAAGGYDGADRAARLAPGAPLPAVGLARLPADANASDWLQRLEQEQKLKPVELLSEAESLAAKPTEPSRQAALGIDAGSKQSAASQTKTIVLFVTASEARKILQSLQSQKQADKKEAARQNLPSQQTAKDNAGAALAEAGAAPQGVIADEVASELPSAWWTRPQGQFESQSADAKSAGAKTDGEEKVILILNQVPRG